MTQKTKQKSNYLLVILMSFTIQMLFGSNVESKAFQQQTSYSIKLNGIAIEYQATVGLMPIYNQKHQLMATMSYISYHQLNADGARPLTFIWSGGPGASSLTDNFLVSGPKIVDLNSGNIATNPETWLKHTDLVYIDMVGTGWGRPVSETFEKEIYTPNGDARTFSEFIKAYLIQTKYKQSEIYLSGVSYGGYRAPLVATNLLKNFIGISGIILQSPLLRPSYSFGEYDNLMSFILSLPTYTQAALHYHKLSQKRQDNPRATILESEIWSINEYPKYLLSGTSLTPLQLKQLENKLHDYTGLSKEVIRNCNYRLSMSTFRDHLINDENKSIDYTNATMSNYKLTDTYDFYIFTMKSVMESFTLLYTPAMHYLATNMKVEFPEEYVNYFDPSQVWHSHNSEVVSILRDDMIIDPNMRLFVGVGYYDTDIPYMVTKTLINQMYPADLKKRIELHEYKGGHMFSFKPAIRKNFNQDIANFFKNSKLSDNAL